MRTYTLPVALGRASVMLDNILLSGKKLHHQPGLLVREEQANQGPSAHWHGMLLIF